MYGQRENALGVVFLLVHCRVAYRSGTSSCVNRPSVTGTAPTEIGPATIVPPTAAFHSVNSKSASSLSALPDILTKPW